MENIIKKEMPLTYLQSEAKRLIKNKQMDEARDTCDLAISYIAEKRFKKQWDVKDIIEETPLETWLMRFWVMLENNGLMRD